MGVDKALVERSADGFEVELIGRPRGVAESARVVHVATVATWVCFAGWCVAAWNGAPLLGWGAAGVLSVGVMGAARIQGTRLERQRPVRTLRVDARWIRVRLPDGTDELHSSLADVEGVDVTDDGALVIRLRNGGSYPIDVLHHTRDSVEVVANHVRNAVKARTPLLRDEPPLSGEDARALEKLEALVAQRKDQAISSSQ